MFELPGSQQFIDFRSSFFASADGRPWPNLPGRKYVVGIVTRHSRGRSAHGTEN